MSGYLPSFDQQARAAAGPPGRAPEPPSDREHTTGSHMMQTLGTISPNCRHCDGYMTGYCGYTLAQVQDAVTAANLAAAALLTKKDQLTQEQVSAAVDALMKWEMVKPT